MKICDFSYLEGVINKIDIFSSKFAFSDQFSSKTVESFINKSNKSRITFFSCLQNIGKANDLSRFHTLISPSMSWVNLVSRLAISLYLACKTCSLWSFSSSSILWIFWIWVKRVNNRKSNAYTWSLKRLTLLLFDSTYSVIFSSKFLDLFSKRSILEFLSFSGVI